jgi:hypothetical protein
MTPPVGARTRKRIGDFLFLAVLGGAFSLCSLAFSLLQLPSAVAVLFKETSTGSTTWTGSVRLPVPDLGTVALTGPTFKGVLKRLPS